ncbi:MAG TPA: hypothetical protein ENJ09_12245 [Planctomycetes bacterium]|nr:hypothetical protein [Planctomycetota bacterium]
MIRLENDSDYIELSRAHRLVSSLAFVGASLFLLDGGGLLPGDLFLFLAAILAIGLVLASALTWNSLFRFARHYGGPWYAWCHLTLAVVLTPLLLIGVLLVPMLVASDVRRGFPGWRCATALSWKQRLVRTAEALGLAGALFYVALHVDRTVGAGLLLAIPAICIVVVRATFRARVGEPAYSSPGRR